MTAPVATAQALADILAYVGTLDHAEALGEARHTLGMWVGFEANQPPAQRDPTVAAFLVLTQALVRRITTTDPANPVDPCCDPSSTAHSCDLLGRVMDAHLRERFS